MWSVFGTLSIDCENAVQASRLTVDVMSEPTVPAPQRRSTSYKRYLSCSHIFTFIDSAVAWAIFCSWLCIGELLAVRECLWSANVHAVDTDSRYTGVLERMDEINN